MASTLKTPKPHAICVPFPIQGHINPMLKLAILLHHKGFHITFIHTEDNYKRLVESQGHVAVEGLPDFQIATIRPEEEEDGGDETKVDGKLRSQCISASKICLAPLTELIIKLNSSTPPVSCVVADVAMPYALDAAEEFGVPGVLLQTSSACSDMCYLHVSNLLEKGLIPLKDEDCLRNGYLDTPIDWIPGMIPLRLGDFPSFILSTDPNDPLLNHLLEEIARASKASFKIMNTFDELEHDSLTTLSSILSSQIYTLGPLHLFLNTLIKQENNMISNLKLLSSSLLKHDPEVLRWLDSKPQGSVIYVNFGSTTVLTSDQMSEFAWGLANSKNNFLWALRPDLVDGQNVALTPDYQRKIVGSGHVVGWCNQEEVLGHPAVGGFLTHCGWNSISESLCNGVPILCWPFFTDQHINCKYACEAWGIGMEIDRDVRRDDVAFLVKELMDGEKGKIMKKMAMEWKEKAAEAVAFGGSSYLNLEKLVNVLLG